MTKLPSLFFSFLFFIEIVLCLPNAYADESPNIILIMADDLGWADTSYNGHKILRTPNLDAMSKNGITFNRFYSAAPVCSPTRGSCLTGRHPYRYGIFSANVGHLKKQEYTIAEYLKEKNYRTGHFGKWHLGTLTTKVKDSNRGGPKNVAHFSTPMEHGFDTYFATEAKVPTFDPLIKPPKAGNKFWLPIGPNKKSVSYGTRYWNDGVEVTDELKGDDSAIIMDQALKFIETKTDKTNPFLSVIWFHAPHLPVVASAEDRAAFKSLDEYSQSYFGSVKAMDRQIGRLRTKLRELQIEKNTIVFFCSDNGPEGNDQAPGGTKGLRGRKRSLYEGGIRVPGIVEWPNGIKTPRTVEFPAVTSDYFSTIVEATGGTLKNKKLVQDGESLYQLITANQKQIRTKPIFFESGKSAAVVTQQYKLIAKVSRKTKEMNSIELYDLTNDPSEKSNIVKLEADLAKDLEKKLRQWRDSCRHSLDGGDYNTRDQRTDGID